ncbi:MAG: hypothetical protein AMJ73_01920 [candidate division Zixibacteria bacterium SM1_73]|nr:MAG: hypothetical protein AMJ73_01920 [candidate division Zixibacteria bacterium SM1_73]
MRVLHLELGNFSSDRASLVSDFLSDMRPYQTLLQSSQNHINVSNFPAVNCGLYNPLLKKTLDNWRQEPQIFGRKILRLGVSSDYCFVSFSKVYHGKTRS